MGENLVQIGAKVPAELAEAVARLADDGDRSISGEIRRAIREHVDRSGGSLGSARPLSPDGRHDSESSAEAPAPEGES